MQRKIDNGCKDIKHQWATYLIFNIAKIVGIINEIIWTEFSNLPIMSWILQSSLPDNNNCSISEIKESMSYYEIKLTNNY